MPSTKPKLLEKEIANKFYGRRLMGTKVFFDGFKELPKFMKEDGSFPLGKHILEALKKKYNAPKLIFTNQGVTRKESNGKSTKFYLCLSDYEKIKKLVNERRLAFLFPYSYGNYGNLFMNYSLGFG